MRWTRAAAPSDVEHWGLRQGRHRGAAFRPQRTRHDRIRDPVAPAAPPGPHRPRASAVPKVCRSACGCPAGTSAYPRPSTSAERSPENSIHDRPIPLGAQAPNSAVVSLRSRPRSRRRGFRTVTASAAWAFAGESADHYAHRRRCRARPPFGTGLAADPSRICRYERNPKSPPAGH